MSLNANNDSTSIRIQLNELKSQFDHAIRDGDDFTNLKAIHLKIKELECQLNAMEWDVRNQTNPSTRG